MVPYRALQEARMGFFDESMPYFGNATSSPFSWNFKSIITIFKT
jgi:hypothetical protein